jgi:hypothetical protein
VQEDGISMPLALAVYLFQLELLLVLQVNIGMETHVYLKLWVMSVFQVLDGMVIYVFNIQ